MPSASPTGTQLIELSALEQAEAIRSGACSSAELVDTYLERIERFDRRLNSFVVLTAHRARLAALRADRQTRRRGAVLPLFHGVPIGIKDLVPTAGVRTRLGSRAFRYFIPPVSGPVVKRLAAGGFISLGKLATSEFGVLPTTEPEIHPATTNPWDTDRTPGGSSGGSGAAVAAGLLPIAHGSDGGGSVRIPSAFCHLYGFKPSLSLLGNLHGAPNRLGTAVMGPLATTVRDAAAMLDVMAKRPFGGNRTDSCLAACARPPRPLRIHLCLDSAMAPLDPCIEDGVRKTANLLRDLGHEVTEVPTAHGDLATFLPVYQFAVSRIPSVSERPLRPVTQWLRSTGRHITYERARRAQNILCNTIESMFGDADMVLSPTVAVTPPKLREFEDADPLTWFSRAATLGAFTAAFNLTTGPAATHPFGLTKTGLPFGVQLGARQGHDRELLSLSRQLEQASPWRHRRAPGYFSDR